MIHIHPFPARMAPEIALNGMESIPRDYEVLDPMSGSGIVIGTAAKLGISATGLDLDPLACLISRTNATYVNGDRVSEACEELLSRCRNSDPDDIFLPWLDADEETTRYVNFWFAREQRDQLRTLSYHLVVRPFTSNTRVLDILKVAMSRLIVSKEPRASLARDTAHSRPHKVINKNDFDVFEAMPHSLKHVLSALRPEEIKRDARAFKGDARVLGRVRDASVDCIITSPPYLNAIDYMRGHRLSLVWMGYSLQDLRRVRTRSVGTETAKKSRISADLLRLLPVIQSGIDERNRRILQRYYRDLCALTRQAHRVLKPGRTATYVIGNSNIQGCEIENSTVLEHAATRSGFRVIQKHVRDIPENRRYMPVRNSAKTSLSKRMREEHVMVFEKSYE